MEEAIIEDYDDKYPNIDGHIEFLNDNGSSTSVRLLFQIKGTEQQGLASYSCPKDFLSYCYISHDPIALIFVNIPDNKVYWQLIDRSYITSVLGIQDLASFDQETKNITFSDDRVIDKNAPTLLGICAKRWAEMLGSEEYQREAKATMRLVTGQEEDQRILHNKLASAQESATDEIRQTKQLEKQPIKETFADLERKFLERTSDLPGKMMLYHSFVYALRPFYLDLRNQQKRVKLLGLLNITEAEERYIVENLTKADLLGRVGSLIFVTNKEQAAVSLDHYFEAGVIDPEQVAELFSDEEDQ